MYLIYFINCSRNKGVYYFPNPSTAQSSFVPHPRHLSSPAWLCVRQENATTTMKVAAAGVKERHYKKVGEDFEQVDGYRKYHPAFVEEW